MKFSFIRGDLPRRSWRLLRDRGQTHGPGLVVFSTARSPEICYQRYNLGLRGQRLLGRWRDRRRERARLFDAEGPTGPVALFRHAGIMDGNKMCITGIMNEYSY